MKKPKSKIHASSRQPLVLGLAASPRHHGSTEILLDAYLDAAREAGGKVEKIRLADLNLQPCTGCYHCHQKGICRYVDDIKRLQPRLLRADILVLASPVYFYSVTSQAKLLIDRSQNLWAARHLLEKKRGQPGGKGVLLSVAASKGAKVFDGMILTVRYFLDTLGKSLDAVLAYRLIEEPADILRHSTALAEVRNLACKMVVKLR